MCTALPGRVLSADGARALVEVGGVARDVSALALPGLAAGDHVLVALGMTVERVTADEARELEALLAELGAAADTASAGRGEAQR
jgi:hydrogenase expression/formation protein HypC